MEVVKVKSSFFFFLFLFGIAMVVEGGGDFPSRQECIRGLRSGDVKRQKEILQYCLKLGPRASFAIGEILPLLRSSHPSVVNLAVRVLSGMGKAAVEPVLSEFSRSSSLTRPFLSQILANIGRDAVPKLRVWLRSKDVSRRLFAVRTFAKMGYRARWVIEDLGERLDDSSERVRGEVVRIFIQLKGLSYSILLRKLRGGSLRVRVGCVRALAGLVPFLLKDRGKLDGMVSELVGLYSESGLPLRLELVKAFGKMGVWAKPALGVLVESYGTSSPVLRAQILAVLAKIGPPRRGSKELSKLRSLFSHSQLEVRHLAARVVGSMGVEGVEIFRSLLGSGDRRLRRVALEGLVVVGKAAVPLLKLYLRREFDRDWRFQVEVLDALRRIGGQAREVIPLLFAVLERSIAGKRRLLVERCWRTVESLLPLRSEDLVQVMPYLRSGHRQLRVYAERVFLRFRLRDRGGVYPFSLLFFYLPSTSRVYRYARFELVRYGKGDPDALVEALLRFEGVSFFQELWLDGLDFYRYHPYFRGLFGVFRELGELVVGRLVEGALRDFWSLMRCSHALGFLGEGTLRVVMKSILKHRRSSLGYILSKLGRSGLSAALGLLYSGDRDLEEVGVVALVGLGRRSILPLLLHASGLWGYGKELVGRGVG
ncbi:MAG: HEAT repeat domain-containing protein, partial [Planctomycetota bacterium]